MNTKQNTRKRGRPRGHSKNLTERQKIFVKLYVEKNDNGFSTERCLKEAGYIVSTSKSAAVCARQLLRNPVISSAIARYSEKYVVDRSPIVLKEVKKVIEHIKKESGIFGDIPDDANASSRARFTAMYLECLDKYPVSTGFCLKNGTVLEKVDQIIDAMSEGKVSIYLGDYLIKNLKIRMEIATGSDLLERMEEIENRVNSNSNKFPSLENDKRHLSH